MAKKYKRQDLLTRFLKHVYPEPNTGCHLFDIGGRYGTFTVEKNHTIGPHRFAYEKFIGPIPSGMVVCHHCDVKCCVNPDHLFLGTSSDNVQDRVRKDRTAKGESQGSSKLRSEQVIEIRRLYKTGNYSYNQLADRFGVHYSNIGYIVKRKQWAWLSDG